MEEQSARAIIPIWASEEEPKKRERADMQDRLNRFIRDHMVTVILAAVMFVEGVVVFAGTAYTVRKETEAKMEAIYTEKLEMYKQEQAYQEQAKAFLSGTDSLNVAVNQTVDVIAPIVARLQTDTQKKTEVGIMIARTLNSGFPNSLQEVAEQKDQWPLYDGSVRTYTAHDWELVEEIIRPFMENGILPLDLTPDIVFATWSETDLIGRDSYYTDSIKNTWKYHG